MARILLIGATGRLGSAVHKLIPDCFAPTRAELDITSPRSISIYLGTHGPIDTIINCAGYSNAADAEKYLRHCWRLNADAPKHLRELAKRARIAHISTDYVFDGESFTDCREDDIPNPINFYGVTKLVGEREILQDGNRHLVIRSPFRPDPPWRYPKAFTDQWTSCRWISEVAPDIVQAALMEDLTGIIHIGGPRRSIYDMARQASPDVGQMTRADFSGLRIPRDTSLDSSKWHSLKAQFTQSSQLAGIST